MDWLLAIERNRQALLGIVAAILALLGGRDGDGAIARGLRSAVLALLRPAEAAARRLIVIAARGLAVTLPSRRPLLQPIPARAAGGGRTPSFALFERPKRHRLALRVEPRSIPRIRGFWGPPLAQPVPPPPASPPVRPLPDAMVDAAPLRLRLAALELALADLPRQARRLARRQARQASTPQRPMRPPLRFGRPPGWRKSSGQGRPLREVDRALRECHALAADAQRPDTS